MQTHITMTTLKMGQVPSVSLVPGVGCPSHRACSKSCYAKRLVYSRPTLRRAWGANAWLALHHRDKYFSDIFHLVSVLTPRFFRWHVAGDILDQDYLNRMIELVNRTQHTQHLAFTKRHELDFRNLPSRLTVVFSMWNGTGDPEAARRQGLACAWVRNRKDPDPRIPPDAIDCPGGCDECGACWALPSLGRDVVFDQR